MKLLSFDPGTQKIGWASFENGRLLLADKSDRNVEWMAGAPDLVLVEMPRWYPHERRIDVNDLLDLSVVVGEIREHFRRLCKVEFVWPRTWKGTVPKEVMSQRIYEALTADEIARLPKRAVRRGRPHKGNAKDVDHNILDAVGLGLWKLGRMYGLART